MALGVLMLAYFGSRLQVSYRTQLDGCVRDPGTGGASGVARWAERLGFAVRPLSVPVWEAPDALPASDGNCIVTMGDHDWSPMREEMGPEEWLGTHKWLSRGNTLIVVTTEPASLPKSMREALVPWSKDQNPSRSRPFFGTPPVEARPKTDPAKMAGGESLTVVADGPRWKLPEKSAAGSSKEKPEDEPVRFQLAGDERGGVLYRVPVGQGAVYILLDDFAWTNAGLDQGDNARILAGVLDRSVRGGVLAFDEYRHGHGRAESFLVFLMNLPGSSAVFWLTAAWVLLYAYGRNVRLRPVEPYVERERRTAQEYIDAVAQLYERARAAPLVVEAVARRLRQVSRSPAEPPASVVEGLQGAEDYAASGARPAAPGAAIRMVRYLIRLRKEIYGTRTVS